jgi:signal transduction histidine kinase
MALLNLAINARDAMPDGGELRVATARRTIDEADVARPPELAPGTYAAIAVTDTGAGMSPEVRARAFEPFFTTKPPGHGTGLGLPSVHGAIRQRGGAVTVDSAPGCGTTFTLLLPLSTAPLGTIEEPPPRVEVHAPGPRPGA